MGSHSPQPAPAPSSPLLRLPAELMGVISCHLSNRDIKTLRETSKSLLDKAPPLRLGRVFLSANPLNTQVLRAVADHDTFRKRVVELIWDETYLSEDLYYRYKDGDRPDEVDGCPRWYTRHCEKNISDLAYRKSSDASRPDHIARARQMEAEMPHRDAWAYYQQLLRQQKRVIDRCEEIEAFRYALERFPALKRVTVTPEAHGWLFNPLYETPMIRAFPAGFNYPIPRGGSILNDHRESAEPWLDEVPEGSAECKYRWHAFRTAARILASTENHRVSELVLGGGNLETGVNCRIFDRQTQPCKDLSALLRRPGFRRLDLSLLTCRQIYDGWSSFRSGHLRQTLGEATDLRHISLGVDALTGTLGDPRHHTPLQRIIPIEKWSRLEHLGLSRLLVERSDLFSLLAALPPTLRSVELRFLIFVRRPGDSNLALDTRDNFFELLTDMRDTLGWRARPKAERPRVSIIRAPCPALPGRTIWLDREVNEFLYGDGANPFAPTSLPVPRMYEGKGIQQDEFEPAHERPNLDVESLVRLGILQGPQLTRHPENGRAHLKACFST
ncbi:hypothetical protein ACJZ2D_010069 [Fusarium nematophilum]